MTEPKPIRLAMLGMIEGNGHPWSWSAIINGYNAIAMEQCPYPVIREYLSRQLAGSVGIEGAQVTHIWTDNPDEAEPISMAAGITQVVRQPEEVIGHVDAVIIATDDGEDHVRRARPFVQAGLPVFIDKPMATNMSELRQFVRWHQEGRILLSTSGMRYAPEMKGMRDLPAETLRWITSFTCKSWERYGIHALEAVYPLVGPGIESVQAVSRAGEDFMFIKHTTGCPITIAAIADATGSFGVVNVYGTQGHHAASLRDTYSAFRGQLMAFVEMLRTGHPPFEFDQTVEQMLVLIAGIRSRQQGGAVIRLSDLRCELEE